jgi:hypothetical protein
MVSSPQDRQWIFLGFLPRRVTPRPEWLRCPDVEVIASASECLSPGPPERIERWLHNDVGLYASEATALSVIPPGHEGAYTRFAYRALSICFREGEEHSWDPWAGRAAESLSPDLSGYDLLGHDAVGASEGGFFECSPLSCNGVAVEQDVNRFCLVDEPGAAIALAQTFSHPDSHVEPAWAYLVVQVLTCRISA